MMAKASSKSKTIYIILIIIGLLVAITNTIYLVGTMMIKLGPSHSNIVHDAYKSIGMSISSLYLIQSLLLPILAISFGIFCIASHRNGKAIMIGGLAYLSIMIAIALLSYFVISDPAYKPISYIVPILVVICGYLLRREQKHKAVT